jgi:hypothetical protein
MSRTSLARQARAKIGMHSRIGLALRIATFTLIRSQFARLTVAAGLLVVSHSIDGEIARLLLIFPAITTGGLAFYCMRETAYGVRNR